MKRREILKLMGAAAVGAFVGPSVSCVSVTSVKNVNGLPIKIAAYDYDRVRAIMDGRVGIEGTEVDFHVEDIYAGLFAVTPIQTTLREHMRLIQQFPHRVSEVTPKGAELTPHD